MDVFKRYKMGYSDYYVGNHHVFLHRESKSFKDLVNAVMQKNVKFLVLFIAVITFVSGVVQIVVPGFVLGFIGAEVTRYTTHLFSIIGMFMALFGGMIVNALYIVQ